MMRLREQTSDDPATQAGNELLRRIPGTASSPEMKRRVWASLADSETRAALGAPVWRLPVVVAAAVVMLVAGSAGAVIARRFFAPARRAAVTRPAPVGSAPGAHKPSQARAGRVGAEPPPSVVEPPVEVQNPAPVIPLRASTARAARRARAPVADRMAGPASADTAAAQPSPRERAEVLDAMIALRRDHDAVRAGQLLDRYLTARPHGALREEALALAIEAAAARGDQGSVSSWARTYQADYPTGRFAGFARDHLTRP